MSFHPFVHVRADLKASNGWFGGNPAARPDPFQSNVRNRADLAGSNESFDLSRTAHGISFHPSTRFRPAGKLSDDSFDGIGVVREPSGKSSVRPRAAFPASDRWNNTVQPVEHKSTDPFGFSLFAWMTAMQSSLPPSALLGQA